MSNLNSKFDVLRGWPHGSAVDEEFEVADGATVYEGQLVVLDADGKVELPAAVSVQGDTGKTALRMVITGNDQWDGSFTGKAVVLRGPFTVATDKFVPGAYTPGELVTVDVAGADAGYITKRTATNELVVGEVEHYDSAAGVLRVSMSL